MVVEGISNMHNISTQSFYEIIGHFTSIYWTSLNKLLRIEKSNGDFPVPSQTVEMHNIHKE